jgi:2-amino-4-hydroxy-6-hydroxymethyldihydropteridine diphosphokinase
MDRTAFIGVGSNVDARKNCIEGIRRVMEDKRVTLLVLSSLYCTSPVSPVAQDDFVNCVLKIGWRGDAMELLYLLESLEQQMGRKRTVPLGPRTLDLDILLIDKLVFDSSRLTIPHPRLHERKFVLVPCLEIDENLIHPVTNLSFRQLLNALGDEQKVALLERISEDELGLESGARTRGVGS